MSSIINAQLRPERVDSALAGLSGLEGIASVHHGSGGRATFAPSEDAARDLARTLAIVTDIPGILSAMSASAADPEREVPA